MTYRRGYTQLRWFMVSAVLLLLCPMCVARNEAPRGRIVYAALVSPEEYTHDGGRFDLFLQEVPSGKVTRLTDHRSYPKRNMGGAIREPLFSSNGKQVTFLVDYANSAKEFRETMTGAAPYPHTLLNVWKVTLPSRTVTSITKGELGWRNIAWSPNSRYFCAVYPSKAGVIDQDTPIPDDIYVWDMYTRKGRKLARVPDMVRDASWSYDGKSILYQSWANGNLYTVPRQGGKSKVLLRGKAGRYGYSFSPDGRRVAYVDTNTVYIANASGSKPKPIIKMIRDEHSPYSPKPQWSGNSRKLAIATYEPRDNAQVSKKLHVYNVSTETERVVATLKQLVSDPVWSRDGQWLIVKMWNAGSTDEPDPKTGWYAFHREGLWAVSVADGHIVTLKEPTEETKGLDWFESSK